MPDVAVFLAEADLRQRALVILIATVAALVLLSAAFASFAVFVRVRSEARERRWRRLSAQWEPLVLAALIEPESSDEVHRAVAPGDRMRFVRFILEYHRRMSGQEVDTLKALALPYLGLAARRTNSARPEVRARAVQTLGALGLPEFSAHVTAGLDDPSPLVAMVAARSLCTRRNPEYGAAVLRRVDRFQAWSRGFLASMLAGIGSEVAPHLRRVLGDPAQSASSRAVSAEALRRLADLESGDIAAGVADEEGDPELLASVLRLLSVVGTPAHLGVVRLRAGSADPHVRAAAISALGSLGSDADHPKLLQGMADPSPWVAMSAARSLVAAGGAVVLADLRDSDHPRATLAAQVLLEAGEAP